MKCERYGGEEADGDGERAHTCDCDDLPVVPLAGEMVEILIEMDNLPVVLQPDGQK